MGRSSNSNKRAVISVAMLVVLILIYVIVISMVISGARDHLLTVRRMETIQAFYAAEGGMNMAIRELMINSDEDGDGGIGTISDDGNSASDPTVGSAQLVVTASTASSVTSLTSQGRSGSARRSAKATVAISRRNLLFVVVDAGTPTTQDQAKRTQMEAWGYTVTLISAIDSQANFDAAAAANDVAYITEEVASNSLNTKLKDASIGVVCEEAALNDDFGISSGRAWFFDDQINITDNSHAITSPFSTGLLTITSFTTELASRRGTLAGGLTVLAERTSNTESTLDVIDTGGALYGGGNAAGRRIFLPWGGSGFDYSLLTADGLTIMQRALEWALQDGSLIGHWTLDDGVGATAVDLAASNDGTVNNVTWTTGPLGGALELDGTNGYVSVPSTPTLQLTSALTIAGWVKGDVWGTGSDVDIIARKGDGSPNNYQFAIKNGVTTMFLDDSDSAGLSGNTVLSSGHWYHVAATWNGSEVRIYVDGVIDKNPPDLRGGTIGTDTRPLYIGGRGTSDVLDGIVDDVRIYNRALSAAEVAALANRSVQITAWQEVPPQ